MIDRPLNGCEQIIISNLFNSEISMFDCSGFTDATYCIYEINNSTPFASLGMRKKIDKVSSIIKSVIIQRNYKGKGSICFLSIYYGENKSMHNVLMYKYLNEEQLMNL